MRARFLVLAMLVFPFPAAAQAVSAADVRILKVKSVISNFLYQCTVDVFMDNDDSAPNSVVKVLLPLEVQVILATPGCNISTNAPHGFVTCDLGTLNVGDMRSMEVWATVPPPYVSRKACAAFIMSNTPDGDLSNNYMKSSEP